MENICEILQMLELLFFMTVYGISQSPLPHPLLFLINSTCARRPAPERRGRAVNLVSEQRALSACSLGGRKDLQIPSPPAGPSGCRTHRDCDQPQNSREIKSICSCAPFAMSVNCLWTDRLEVD